MCQAHACHCHWQYQQDSKQPFWAQPPKQLSEPIETNLHSSLVPFMSHSAAKCEKTCHGQGHHAPGLTLQPAVKPTHHSKIRVTCKLQQSATVLCTLRGATARALGTLSAQVRQVPNEHTTAEQARRKDDSTNNQHFVGAMLKKLGCDIDSKAVTRHVLMLVTQRETQPPLFTQK